MFKVAPSTTGANHFSLKVVQDLGGRVGYKCINSRISPPKDENCASSFCRIRSCKRLTEVLRLLNSRNIRIFIACKKQFGSM